MLDAWLHSHGRDKEKHTSPYAMALLAKAGLQTAGLGNISCNAINKAFKHSHCLDEEFNQNLDTLFDAQLKKRRQRNSDENILSFVNAMENHKNDLNNIRPPQRMSNSQHFRIQKERREFRKTLEAQAQELNCTFQGLDQTVTSFANNTRAILHALEQNSDSSFIRKYTKVMYRTSKEEVNHPRPKCEQIIKYHHAENKTPKKFENKIHELLKSPNPQPIGVGYCSKVISRGPGHRRLNEGILGFTSINSLSDSEDYDLHKSAVIRRRMMNGQCFFKVRNS